MEREREKQKIPDAEKMANAEEMVDAEEMADAEKMADPEKAMAIAEEKTVEMLHVSNLTYLHVNHIL